MTTPYIDPNIRMNINEIDTLIANILSVLIKEGLRVELPVQLEHPEDSTVTADIIMHIKDEIKNGIYANSRLINPVPSYLAIRMQEYCPHINPNAINGIIAINTVLLLYPDSKISRYPPINASVEIKNTFTPPKFMSALGILSKSFSTARMTLTIPTTIDSINTMLKHNITFLCFMKKLFKVDNIIFMRTDAML